VPVTESEHGTPCRFADPEIEICTWLPWSDPDAVPDTVTLPRQIALKVPAIDVAVWLVIDHWNPVHVELSVTVPAADDHVPTIDVPPPPPPPGPVGPLGPGVFGTFDGSMYAGSLFRTNSHPDASSAADERAITKRAVLGVMAFLWCGRTAA
jgi:hypothetical protein